MKPEEIIEALRLALVSGAISAKTYDGPYPATEITVHNYDDVLSITWCGSNIQLMPQGSKHESALVRYNVSECAASDNH